MNAVGNVQAIYMQYCCHQLCSRANYRYVVGKLWFSMYFGGADKFLMDVGQRLWECTSLLVCFRPPGPA